MIKIDIFSGFLGAGKTTLIQKLLREAYQGEKVVLIENEFGEVGIDGGFLKDAGIEINELSSGCICCSLVGDFGKALREVADRFHPERILIEPSGVGKLDDVIAAVRAAQLPDAEIGACITVADATKVKIYARNFGEFYKNQIENAGVIVLSRTAGMRADKLEKAVAMLRAENEHAPMITTPWDQLDGQQILKAGENTVDAVMAALQGEYEHEHHHDHDHEHHHDHDHEHEHGEHCSCGCHDHGHHADEVFVSLGFETAKKYTKEGLQAALEALLESDKYGQVLRAKGIVDGVDGWLFFDYVPGEVNVRPGSADITGRLVFIGSGLNEAALRTLFEIEE